jgi:hypothetical protein
MAKPQVHRPPRISGTVPPDYRGPIYYRTRADHGEYAKAQLFQHLKFANLDQARRLALAYPEEAAVCAAPSLFNRDRELLSIFSEPVQASLRASAPKALPEWSPSNVDIVNERVREAVEKRQPGKHLFIPIDVSSSHGCLRRYAFFVQRDHVQTPLALEANQIAYTINEYGNPVVRAPPWIASDQFGYLSAPVVDGVAVDFHATVGWILSKDLVEELGDVFPKGLYLVPMGVADEARSVKRWEPSAEVLARLSASG